MQFIRKTTLGAVASLFITTLFLFGVMFGLQRVFSTPTAIKSALKQSGIYQTAIPDALEQAQKDQQKNGQSGGDQLPLDRPEVKSIVQNAATPDFLQTQSDTILDAVYAWLQGKTAKLSFSIDLTDVKGRLADGVGQYTQQRLASLPACAPGTVPQGDVDPFNATCLPKGADINALSAQARSQITGGDFLKDTQLNADTLKSKDGKTLDQQLKNAPDIYKKSSMGVYLLGLLVLLLAMAIVFLSKTRRSGFKKVAIIAIVIGTLISLLGWAVSFGLEKASTKIDISNPAQRSGLKVAQVLANDLRMWYLVFGLTLVGLAIATLVAQGFIKPKDGIETAPAKAEKEPVEESAGKPAGAETPAKPRPRPTRKLVQ
ncbi:MAG TPA: hypothetical protein VL737_01545 [Candidatus Pristimantibacillus sp.]|nr:hypothetical protein [Candidatus Pristimantibacillus sp.]